MSNEHWYDTEIAPHLLAVAKACEAKGVSCVFVVEYSPGIRGRTYHLEKNIGIEMSMISLCVTAELNVDGHTFGLMRYCRATDYNRTQGKP